MKCSDQQHYQPLHKKLTTVGNDQKFLGILLKSQFSNNAAQQLRGLYLCIAIFRISEFIDSCTESNFIETTFYFSIRLLWGSPAILRTPPNKWEAATNLPLMASEIAEVYKYWIQMSFSVETRLSIGFLFSLCMM